MANKKLKLLYLARFLQEETDEQHPKTLQDMLSYLAAHGITAERKSVYDDLELLSPEDVRQEFAAHCRTTLELYQ